MIDLGKFVAAMFALSVGVERIIEIGKNIATALCARLALKLPPWFEKKGEAASPPARSAIIQFIAALIGCGMVFFIGSEQFLGTKLAGFEKLLMSVLLGTMSSGGSAFWNQALSLVSAAKQTREATARILSEQEVLPARRDQPPVIVQMRALGDRTAELPALNRPFVGALNEAELFEHVLITPEQPDPRLTAEMAKRAAELLTKGTGAFSALLRREFAKFEAAEAIADMPAMGVFRPSFLAAEPEFGAARSRVLTNWADGNPYPISDLVPWPARAATEVEDLATLLTNLDAGKKVRAVGTLHSTSPVLRSSTDTVIIQAPEPRTLAPLLDLRGKDFLEVGNSKEAWVRLRGVAHIRDVVVELERIGYALGNQGGFSGQTLAGALSCSTHGSGAGSGFGPLSDFVDAYDFMGRDGKVTRVQANHCPLTLADLQQTYGQRVNRLIKETNDDVLKSARVSFGEWGIIHSVIMRVVPRYLLGETRTLTTWEEERAGILALSAQADLRHLEVWINPYPNIFTHHHTAVLVKRQHVDWGTALASAGYQDTALEIAKSPAKQKFAAWCAYNLAPEIVGAVLEDQLLKLRLNGTRIARADDVFDIGLANELHAVSGEYVFPEADAVEAVDSYLRLLHINAGRHRPHPGWVSLRFVNGSTSRMSMFHGPGRFCTVELPLITGGTHAWRTHIQESLMSYQNLCLELQGRMHWAQSWELNGPELKEYLSVEYPEFATWREHQAAVGTAAFDNGCFPPSI